MSAVLKYDILDTYHDDDYQDDVTMVKSLCEISVHDLGGVNHYVYLTKNKKFGFDLEIINEEDQVTYKDKEFHPYALDSIATFCRSFLRNYDHVMAQMEKTDA